MQYSLASSNPALRDKSIWERREMAASTCSLQGVVNKTAMFLAVAVGGGAAGYSVASTMPAVMWISGLAAFAITIGIYFVIAGNPARAKFVGWIYAAVEGFFLGAVAQMLTSILIAQGIDTTVMGGIGLQAFIITLAVTGTMLVLYTMGILRPTKRFKAVVMTLTGAIFVTYMVSFVLSIFGVGLPLINVFTSSAGGGWMPLVALGINLLILGVASLWLIIDFGMIEDMVKGGAPKDMEWFGAFALLVTLAWVYLEALKLCFRLAMMFSSRD